MRILLVQRSLSPPGGGNAVAAWILHALAGVHDVTTVTNAPWTAAETNAFYGTSIPERISQHVVGAPWSWLERLPEHRYDRLRMSSVLRGARRLQSRYDLCITGDNYAPFARPGIQYVHVPVPFRPTPWRLPLLVNPYFRLCDAIVGLPWELATRNLTLTNSAWTAAAIAQHPGVAAQVVYPPVVDPGEGLPWEQRSNSFLVIGRFHGSKRIEVAMSIVRRLRAHALPGARLIIVGSPVDPEYTRRLHRFAARDTGWIAFREDLSRAELNRLMGESRYAIQPMVDEHFGMATAELVRCGCLVFAHRSGGSPEVLAGADELLWQTEDEAVARVSTLVRDTPRRDALRWTLRRYAARFSPEQFVDHIRAIVAAWPSGELAERRIAQ